MAIMVFAPCVASGLVHSYGPMLSQKRFGLGATTVGSKAIFAGGGTVGGGVSNVVDIYDASLGAPTNPAAWSTATLSQAREWLCAVTVGNKAIFAGGRLSGGVPASNRVDIYDASSGTWSTASLSQVRYNLAATTLGNIGIFGGGNDLSGSCFDRVDIYDASLGEPTDPAAWATDALSQARANLAATTVGDYAIFAGGQVGSNYSDVVDIYSSWLKVSIDIKPGGCPNPLNVKDKGVLSVAILGSEDFDVWTIDTASIRLEGIAPVRSSYEDVATPMPDGAEVCECTTEGSDGYLDLVLKFNVQDIVATLGEVEDGDEFELTLMGELADGTPIQGKDCIVVITKGGK